MIGYARAAPGFVLRLAVSALVIWSFLYAVAAGVTQATGGPTNSWASIVWVLAVGSVLVMVDARQLRYRLFLANLGVSRVGVWLAGWLMLAGSELLLQVALLFR